MSLTSTDSPRRHRYSVADFYRMGEAGILPPDSREELIDGVIFDVPRPSPLHAATVTRLNAIFQRAAGDEASVGVHLPVRLSEFSEPQPDVSLLKSRDDFYSEHHPGPVDVLLIVEVADSTLRFDRDTRVPLYAVHGIAEMWLVDLIGRRLVRHRAPTQGIYTLVDEPDLGTPLDLAALPGVTVDLKPLFGG
jgi:Uma2 family endonuclease